MPAEIKSVGWPTCVGIRSGGGDDAGGVDAAVCGAVGGARAETCSRLKAGPSAPVHCWSAAAVISPLRARDSSAADPSAKGSRRLKAHKQLPVLRGALADLQTRLAGNKTSALDATGFFTQSVPWSFKFR